LEELEEYKFNRGVNPPDGVRHREVVEGQTGPAFGAVQFIVGIPEETRRDDIVARYVGKLLQTGSRIDEETEQVGFEEEWPPDVRSVFDLGHGNRWSWPDLQLIRS